MKGSKTTAFPTKLTWYLPTGPIVGYDGIASIPVTGTAPTSAGYVGTNGNEWIIMGIPPGG